MLGAQSSRIFTVFFSPFQFTFAADVHGAFLTDYGHLCGWPCKDEIRMQPQEHMAGLAPPTTLPTAMTIFWGLSLHSMRRAFLLRGG